MRHLRPETAGKRWGCAYAAIAVPTGSEPASGINLDGVVRLRARDRRLPEATSSSRRGSNLGEIAPATKGAIVSGKVLGGSEVVTAELEVVVDPAVSGQEVLSVKSLAIVTP